MQNFDNFKKERKIFRIDDIRNKHTLFKKLMDEGRIVR